MIRNCPNCSKWLKFNYDKKRWECPKILMRRNGSMYNYGCGWFNEQTYLGDNGFI